MIVAFVFILGLFIGSFLNVVILRLHRQESFIKGASKCLFCKHRLYPKDLVPLFSFLFLQGRCRYCKKRFSQQYPLVELATGLAFVLVFLKVIPSLDLTSISALQFLHLLDWWMIVGFLIIIFVYDLKYYLILDKVVWPAIVLAFFANLFLGFSILNLVLAAVIGGGFFLLQFVMSKGRWIGGGDIRLGVFMGVILGWPHILTALFISYILGSFISIFLLLGKRKEWGDKVPFGTFLALGTFVTMLWGSALMKGYLALFY
ncbi:MAG: prepilin peptidase [Patescibacteria group bacterium]|jgi:prepilin signal peptidase PulO-like enzyme (type II secretory pathway)